MKYGSEESVELSGKIGNMFRDTIYTTSCSLGKERGNFEVFNWEQEKECEFYSGFPDELLEKMQNGRRNISLMAIAPAGTISVVAQTSSGIEPVFRNSMVRRRKLSDDSKADFVDASGDRWKEYEVEHQNVVEWKTKHPEQALPDFFVTSEQIDWETRVRLLGVVQHFIDHGISVTINAPAGTLSETVGKIYSAAWNAGVKGMTVYVAGSRDGVLLEKESFPVHNAPKRPESLPCDIFQTTVEGDKFTVLVGLLNDKPYEIFAGKAEHILLPRKAKAGTIKKEKHVYNLLIGEGDDELEIIDIVKTFNNPLYGTMTRLLSMLLRHGAAPKFVVLQLRKNEDESMNSFAKTVARTLKRYVENGDTAGEKCPECGAELVYQSGCVQCPSCAWSKCG
jgi:ribonucleoside-diphosphate reductase alpha chain